MLITKEWLRVLWGKKKVFEIDNNSWWKDHFKITRVRKGPVGEWKSEKN